MRSDNRNASAPGAASNPAEDWSIEQRFRDLKRQAKGAAIARPPFPKNIMIELSNACNHACIFCANPKMTRTKKRIDFALGSSILAQARALGATEVGFYTTGDPFVHRDLARFVAEAKRLGYGYVYIATNGALATPERSRAVIDAGLDSVKFSINAGTRTTYAWIHGKDDWDKVIANLKYISEYRKTIGSNLKLAVSYVITPQNKGEFEEFRRWCEPLVDDVWACDVDNQQGYMMENHEFFGTATLAPIAAPCYMVFARAHVTAEGYLTLCCVDYENYLAVADLSVVSLEEAWNSPKFVEMRERHLKNKLEGTLCFNCLNGQKTVVLPLTPEFASVVDLEEMAAGNLQKQRGRTVRLTVRNTTNK